MSSIPQARKQSILNKMLSANPPTVSSLSKQEGISEATLYNWRKQLRSEGRSVPEPDRTSESWSAATKFAVVVETAALSETELAEYCRGKGLYPEQVKSWREAAISSQDSSAQAAADKQEQARDYRKQIKRLEREIARKDKALAEAAALLVLQKKMRALWEGGEEE
jgi:transposase-like protein